GIDALIGSSLPVLDDGDGRRGFSCHCIHEKSLPVRRDHILLPIVTLPRPTNARGEQRHRSARVKSSALWSKLNGHSHDASIHSDVELFLAVPPPASLGASTVGDPDTGSRAREGLGPNLESTRVV